MIKLFPIFILTLLSGCASVGMFGPVPELHSIGVYEGTAPEDDGLPWHAKCGQLSLQSCHQRMTQRARESGGQVIVNISIIDKPLVLAFTAYDKTKWIVRLEDGVSIEKVILGGYHSQSIEGIPEDTPIEVYTYDSSPCPRCYQGDMHFYSYKGIPDDLKTITDIPVTSWQGKYRGLEFYIFPNMNHVR